MKVCFIGGGNMATAMIGGLIARGVEPAGIGVVEIDAAARERLARASGVRCAATPAEVVPGSDAVVLAVKPQQMRAAAVAAGAHAGQAVLLSIAAGIRLSDLRRWLARPAVLARAMPNTPALIGRGITGVYAAPEASPAQRALVEQILAAAGDVVWLEREEQLDPVTAISGSGPAYVFLFIEALAQAGESLGLDPEASRRLALATFRGAAELAGRSDESPAALRARVTSKGGTTERAIAVLESGGIRELIGRAAAAAEARAGELAEEFGRDA